MRQLLVTDATAPSISNGVYAAGSLAIEKMDLSNPAQNSTALAAGEFYPDAPKIRFVQGTSSKNIVSPWIEGRNIVAWKGESFVDQVPQSVVHTVTTNPTAAGEVSVKLTDTAPGKAQFERKGATLKVSANEAAATVALRLVKDLISWVGSGNPAASTYHAIPGMRNMELQYAGAAITFRGKTFSITNNTDMARFTVSVEGMDGSNGTTFPATSPVDPVVGYGNAELLAQYEESLQGNVSFYNRVRQPNTPAAFIDRATPTEYDVYSLVYRNGATGQINGVDNLRHITIAFKQGQAQGAVFEGLINDWMSTTPGAFGPVAL